MSAISLSERCTHPAYTSAGPLLIRQRSARRRARDTCDVCSIAHGHRRSIAPLGELFAFLGYSSSAKRPLRYSQRSSSITGMIRSLPTLIDRTCGSTSRRAPDAGGEHADGAALVAVAAGGHADERRRDVVEDVQRDRLLRGGVEAAGGLEQVGGAQDQQRAAMLPSSKTEMPASSRLARLRLPASASEPRQRMIVKTLLRRGSDALRSESDATARRRWRPAGSLRLRRLAISPPPRAGGETPAGQCDQTRGTVCVAGRPSAVFSSRARSTRFSVCVRRERRFHQGWGLAGFRV